MAKPKEVHSAQTIAKNFRNLHFLNIALAGMTAKHVKESCDLAEEALAKTLNEYANHYWNSGYECAEKRYGNSLYAQGEDAGSAEGGGDAAAGVSRTRGEREARPTGGGAPDRDHD